MDIKDSSGAESADILIVNGTVLTMDSSMRSITGGYIAVKDGKIADLGKMEDLLQGRSPGDLIRESLGNGVEIIDADGAIVMPGLINSHTHASMTLFRGLADDLPLMEWLHEHIFPAEAGLNPDWVYTGALLACAEMILSGTTCFCDMYLFENEVARAASDASMRAVVGEVLYDFPSPCYGPLEKGFEYVEGMMDRWSSSSLVTVAVEPHSTYLCSPDLLKRAALIASGHSAPLIIHVAETESESATIKERYGVSPVRFLADNDILSPALLACHSVHLGSEDLELYRQFDVKVAHCPESNMKLASGVAPVPDMMDMGICVGIGTDGCASNNDLDMLVEMDTAAKLHKLFSGRPEVLKAEKVVRAATVDGARALGLGSVTGSLEIGKRADIIVIDTSAPHMVPMYNPYSHLVYSANGSDVIHSIIDGKTVMRGRKLLTVDINNVIKKVREISCSIIRSQPQKA